MLQNQREESPQNVENLLNDFVAQVREKNEKAGDARGREAERMQAELSEFIERKVSELMGQGFSVDRIQDAVRAAVDKVPQTYASDADSDRDVRKETDEDQGEMLDLPFSTVSYFLPLEEAVVSAFAAGELDPSELHEILCEQPCRMPITMPEGLALVLTDYGKNAAMAEITEGGEIVVGADGEAFVPEYLEIETRGDDDDDAFLVCEPMVFKTAEEVHAIAGLLAPMDEKSFYKKAKIKKLIRSGWLDAYEKRSIKKEADYIIGVLWEEFTMLREVYRYAAQSKYGVAIVVAYEGYGN